MSPLFRKPLRYLGLAIGALSAAAAFVWLCGLMIPERHEASASLSVQAAPEAVLAVLTSVEGYPRWRTDVAGVEALDRGVSSGDKAGMVPGLDVGLFPEDGSGRRWRETDADGRVAEHEATVASGTEGGATEAERGSALSRAGATRKWVERFSTADGRARYERVLLIVAEADGGTRIALKEIADLRNPLARFRARFVTRYAENLNALLGDLRSRLGE